MTETIGNQAAAPTAEPAGTEQDALRCTQAFLGYLSKWTQPYKLLAAWLAADLQRLDEKKSLTYYTAERLFQLGEPRVKATPTQWLAQQWKVLGGFAAEHEAGLIGFARQKGFSAYCLPVKETGRGAGNPSEYRLQVKVLPAGETVLPDAQTSVGMADGRVHYIAESIVRPAWFLRGVFRHDMGLVLQGWRKALFIGYWLGVGGFSLLGLLLFLLGSQQAAVSPGAWLQSLSTLAIVGLVVWLAARPLIRLIDWRITSAPSAWLALSEEPAQMELIRGRKDLGEANRIRFVRYSAPCPLCGNKVYLREGGRQFPNRMVGRCEENPAEHVFSFDRVSLLGFTVTQ
ncbi:hypothetical protein [Crenobacter caeni]|uniref:Uncharacterized protein n=1 Tax=Crenobacter caeni TaxID=2705474 RepID=A0A6B2KVV4_9NEIS|nr:hypothetical protein [Crenobacter caeni]NDV14372.1 hypothetical protein [Crenobacter caeni]